MNIHKHQLWTPRESNLMAWMCVEAMWLVWKVCWSDCVNKSAQKSSNKIVNMDKETFFALQIPFYFQ